MQCKNWTLKWTIIISVAISASCKSKSSPLTPSKYAIRIHTLLSATLLLYMLLRPPVHRNIAYNKEYTFFILFAYTLFLKTLSQQEFIQFAFSWSHFNSLPTTRVCKHSVAVHQLYRSLWIGCWVSLRCHFDNSDCISSVLLFFFDSIQNSIKFLSENRNCSSYRSLSFQEWFWMTEERIWSNVFPLRSHVCVFFWNLKICPFFLVSVNIFVLLNLKFNQLLNRVLLSNCNWLRQGFPCSTWRYSLLL